jgi:hypothetical protein
MAWGTKRPQIGSIAIGGIVIEVGNGQRESLGMINVVINQPAPVKQLVRKI